MITSIIITAIVTFLLTCYVLGVARKMKKKQLEAMRKALNYCRQFVADLSRIWELNQATDRMALKIIKEELPTAIEIINESLKNDAGYRGLKRELERLSALQKIINQGRALMVVGAKYNDPEILNIAATINDIAWNAKRK